MKIMQIVNALPSLQKLAGCELSLPKLYKISKLLGDLDGEIAFYYDQRNKILAKYCDIVGNQYVPRAEDEEALNAEMAELLNMNVDKDIQEVALDVTDNVKLSYNDLIAMKDFVRIEGDD
jgi:hypothetical protein